MVAGQSYSLQCDSLLRGRKQKCPGLIRAVSVSNSIISTIIYQSNKSQKPSKFKGAEIDSTFWCESGKVAIQKNV